MNRLAKELEKHPNEIRKYLVANYKVPKGINRKSAMYRAILKISNK